MPLKDESCRTHRRRILDSRLGPRAWCGYFLAEYLGISDRSLWVAQKWATLGHRAEDPQVGAIVVWPHHVGKIEAVATHTTEWSRGCIRRSSMSRWCRTISRQTGPCESSTRRPEMLFEGMIDGIEGQELRELLELSQKEFDTKRRFVRRRLNDYAERNPHVR